MGWRDRAACAAPGVDREWFFEVSMDDRADGPRAMGARASRINAERAIRAKTVCASCPVRGECLAEHMDEEYGIFGGYTEHERARIREGLPATDTASAPASFPELLDALDDFRNGYSLVEIADWYEQPLNEVATALAAAASF